MADKDPRAERTAATPETSPVPTPQLRIHVDDYGAVPDTHIEPAVHEAQELEDRRARGEANSAAFEAALAALYVAMRFSGSPPRGCLVFSPGRYLMSRRLEVGRSGVHLVGCRTVLQLRPECDYNASVPLDDCFPAVRFQRVDEADDPLEIIDAGMTGFTIQQTGSNEWDAGRVGLEVVNAKGFRAHDLSIVRFHRGLHVSADGGVSSGCTFWMNHVWDNVIGFVTSTANGGQIRSINVFGGSWSKDENNENIDGHVRLESKETSNVLFQDCAFEGKGKFDYMVQLGPRVEKIVLSGCRLEGTPENLLVSSAWYVTLHNCHFSFQGDEETGADIRIEEGAGPHYLWGTSYREKLVEPGVPDEVSQYIEDFAGDPDHGRLPPEALVYGTWFHGRPTRIYTAFDRYEPT